MQYNFKNLELYYYKSLPTVWKELNKLQTLKKLILMLLLTVLTSVLSLCLICWTVVRTMISQGRIIIRISRWTKHQMHTRQQFGQIGQMAKSVQVEFKWKNMLPYQSYIVWNLEISEVLVILYDSYYMENRHITYVI